MVAAAIWVYPDAMENRPIVRRAIVVMIVFLVVAMAGMLALGVALYRT